MRRKVGYAMAERCFNCGCIVDTTFSPDGDQWLCVNCICEYLGVN